MRLYLNRKGRTFLTYKLKAMCLDAKPYRDSLWCLNKAIKFEVEGDKFHLELDTKIKLMVFRKYVKSFSPHLQDDYEKKVLELCKN